MANVMPCSLRKANDFVEAHHRHSKRTARDGGKFAIALAEAGSVVGVAIAGNPLSATYMDGLTAEVLRVCLGPAAPRNSNSMLYGACRRIWFDMGGRRIITYTLEEESGASLRGAGWTMEAVIKGHDVATWGKKDHLQRSNQEIFSKQKNVGHSVNETALQRAAAWAEKEEQIDPAPSLSCECGQCFGWDKAACVQRAQHG